ncbi:MAG: DUF2341 domain-containing protein [Candidatus Aenigmatarchaeota archaeon]
MDRGTKILLFIIAIAAIYIVYKSLFPVARAFGDIGPVRVVEGPWLEGWKYRLPVDIGPNTGGDITDTVGVAIIDTKTLINVGLMKPDCSDIRVTDSDGVTLLKFWVQPDSCGLNNTYIYIRLPIVRSGETKRVYIYFGNSKAESASNGYEVFDFFDDFEGEEIDLNKWQISDGTVGDRIYLSGGKLYIESDGYAPVKTIATRERVVKQNSAVIVRAAPVAIHPGHHFGIVLADSLSSPNGVAYKIADDGTNRLWPISGGSWGYPVSISENHLAYRTAIIERRGTTAYLSAGGSTVSITFPLAGELYIIIPRIWNENIGDRGVFAVDFIAVIQNYNEKLMGVVIRNIISTVEIHKDIFDVDVLIPSDKIYFTNQIPLRFRVVSGETGVFGVFINDKEIASVGVSRGIIKNVEIPSSEISKYIKKEGKYTIKFRFEKEDLVREVIHEFIYGIPGLYGDPQYRYRIPIVIEEVSGRDLIDVVIPLRLNLREYIQSGLMRSNCLDITFTDYDGYTKIPFWVERCSDKDWRMQVRQIEIETKAYYSIGTTDVGLIDYPNFPETPISYGDNYYNTYDPWNCNNCYMYIRVYLKYSPLDGEGPQDAFIRIRSDDDQAVWVNGKLVGYGPIGTKAYDITSYIVPGDNEILIMCKEGWGDEYCFFDFIIDGIYINRDGVHTKRVEKIEEEGSLIWVRIPRIAARNNHTIYMYFGSNYLFVGDPYKVFDIYENFSLKAVLDNWDVYTRVVGWSMPPYSVELTGGALRVYVADAGSYEGLVSVVHRKAVNPCNKKVEFEAKFLPNNPAYTLPYGRLYFIGLAEQALDYRRFINTIGFASTEWFSDNIIRTGEKIIWGEGYYNVGDNPTSIRDITRISRIVNPLPYLLGKTIQAIRYFIDLKITDKKIESIWYIADGKEFYQRAYSEIGTSRCTILARPTITAGTWSSGHANSAEIYLYWIRVYNYYEPEPIVYQLGIGENPKYIPTEEETYEETVLEYIQQQEQQTQQPPTYQPPTYQPPTYQPPIYIPPEYQPIMEYPEEQVPAPQPTPQPTPGVQTVIEYVYRQPLLVIAIIILVIAILLATIRK